MWLRGGLRVCSGLRVFLNLPFPLSDIEDWMNEVCLCLAMVRLWCMVYGVWSMDYGLWSMDAERN